MEPTIDVSQRIFLSNITARNGDTGSSIVLHTQDPNDVDCTADFLNSAMGDNVSGLHFEMRQSGTGEENASNFLTSDPYDHLNDNMLSIHNAGNSLASFTDSSGLANSSLSQTQHHLLQQNTEFKTATNVIQSGSCNILAASSAQGCGTIKAAPINSNNSAVLQSLVNSSRALISTPLVINNDQLLAPTPVHQQMVDTFTPISGHFPGIHQPQMVFMPQLAVNNSTISNIIQQPQQQFSQNMIVRQTKLSTNNPNSEMGANVSQVQNVLSLQNLMKLQNDGTNLINSNANMNNQVQSFILSNSGKVFNSSSSLLATSNQVPSIYFNVNPVSQQNYILAPAKNTVQHSSNLLSNSANQNGTLVLNTQNSLQQTDLLNIGGTNTTDGSIINNGLNSSVGQPQASVLTLNEAEDACTIEGQSGESSNNFVVSFLNGALPEHFNGVCNIMCNPDGSQSLVVDTGTELPGSGDAESDNRTLLPLNLSGPDDDCSANGGGSGQHVISILSNEGKLHQQLNFLAGSDNNQIKTSDVSGATINHQLKNSTNAEGDQKPNEMITPSSTMIMTGKNGELLEIVVADEITLPTADLSDLLNNESIVKRDVHREENCIYKCHKCSVSFKKWAKYRKHLQTHAQDKPLQCDQCPMSFNMPKNYRLHKCIHEDGPPFVCPECFKTFRRLASFRSHLVVHEEDETVQCPQCDEEFVSVLELPEHQKTHHGSIVVKTEPMESSEANDDPDSSYSYTYPTFSSIPSDSLENNSQSNETASVKDYQGDRLQASVTVQFEEDTKIIEVQCGENEANTDEFHIQKYSCNRCSASFTSIKNLQDHLAIHKKVRKLARPRGRRKARASYGGPPAKRGSMRVHPCPTCNKIFLKPSQLERHVRIHTGERPFKCFYPGCERAFNQNGTLITHLSTHTGNKPHFCNLCGKKFVQKSNLVCHIRRVHPVERTAGVGFQCEECSCVFKRAGSLNAHISQMHSVPIQMFDEQLDSKKPSSIVIDGNTPECTEALNKENNASDRDSITVLPVGMNQQKKMIFGESNGSDSLASSLSSTNSTSTDNNNKFLAAAASKIGGKIVIKKEALIRSLSVHCKKASNEEEVRTVGGSPFKKTTAGTDILQEALANSGVNFDKHKDATSVGHFNSFGNGSKFHANNSPITMSHQNSNNYNIKSDENNCVASSNSTVSTNDAPLPSSSGTDRPHFQAKDSQILNNNVTKYRYRMVTLTDKINDIVRRHQVYVKCVKNIKYHLCSFANCNKEFRKPSDLLRHLRVHTDDKPYKCSKCFRRFRVKSTLVGHQKTHQPSQPIPCNQCGKKLHSLASLKFHTWKTHMNDGGAADNSEVRRLGTAANMEGDAPKKARRRPKVSDRVNNIPLPDVALQEPLLVTEQGPITQVARNSEVYNSNSNTSLSRPHKCRYCPAALKKASHLKQHERIHTGERPYRCSECTKHFSSTSVLRAHMRTHAGQKTCACPHCNRLFATISSVKRHMSTHSKQRPYMCPYCQKRFKTNSNCKKHLQTHRTELSMQAVRAAGAHLQGDQQEASEKMAAATSLQQQLNNNLFTINKTSNGTSSSSECQQPHLVATSMCDIPSTREIYISANQYIDQSSSIPSSISLGNVGDNVSLIHLDNNSDVITNFGKELSTNNSHQKMVGAIYVASSSGSPHLSSLPPVTTNIAAVTSPSKIAISRVPSSVSASLTNSSSTAFKLCVNTHVKPPTSMNLPTTGSAVTSSVQLAPQTVSADLSNQRLLFSSSQSSNIDSKLKTLGSKPSVPMLSLPSTTSTMSFSTVSTPTAYESSLLNTQSSSMSLPTTNERNSNFNVLSAISNSNVAAAKTVNTTANRVSVTDHKTALENIKLAAASNTKTSSTIADRTSIQLDSKSNSSTKGSSLDYVSLPASELEKENVLSTISSTSTSERNIQANRVLPFMKTVIIKPQVSRCQDTESIHISAIDEPFASTKSFSLSSTDDQSLMLTSTSSHSTVLSQINQSQVMMDPKLPSLSFLDSGGSSSRHQYFNDQNVLVSNLSEQNQKENDKLVETNEFRKLPRSEFEVRFDEAESVMMEVDSSANNGGVYSKQLNHLLIHDGDRTGISADGYIESSSELKDIIHSENLGNGTVIQLHDGALLPSQLVQIFSGSASDDITSGDIDEENIMILTSDGQLLYKSPVTSDINTIDAMKDASCDSDAEGSPRRRKRKLSQISSADYRIVDTMDASEGHNLNLYKAASDCESLYPTSVTVSSGITEGDITTGLIEGDFTQPSSSSSSRSNYVSSDSPSKMKGASSSATRDPKRRSTRTQCCTFCEKNFTSRHTLVAHMKEDHSEKHWCEICQQVFPNIEQLRKHRTTSHRQWTCPICQEVFYSIYSMQQHLKQHPRPVVQSALLGPYSVRSGRPAAHPTNNNSGSSDMGSTAADDSAAMPATEQGTAAFNKNKKSCQTCGKSFKKPSDLVRHIRTHTGERPYKCKQCGKSFAVNSTLVAHVRSHSGAKNYKCDVCSAYFASKGSFSIHMRIHTGHKPLKCPHCQMRFRTSGHRKAHILTHFKTSSGVAAQSVRLADNINSPDDDVCSAGSKEEYKHLQNKDFAQKVHCEDIENVPSIAESSAEVEGISSEGGLSLILPVPPSVVQNLNLPSIEPGTILSFSNIQNLGPWFNSTTGGDKLDQLRKGKVVIGTDSNEENSAIVVPDEAGPSVNPNMVMAGTTMAPPTVLSQDEDDRVVDTPYNLPVDIMSRSSSSQSSSRVVSGAQYGRSASSKAQYVTSRRTGDSSNIIIDHSDLGFTKLSDDAHSNVNTSIENISDKEDAFHGKQYICSYCRIVCSSFSSLQNHKRTSHSDSYRVLPSPSKESKKSHQIHERDRKHSSINSSKYSTETTEKIDNSSVKCLFCTEVFSSRADLGAHVTANHLYKLCDSDQPEKMMGLSGVRWKDFTILDNDDINNSNQENSSMIQYT